MRTHKHTSDWVDGVAFLLGRLVQHGAALVTIALIAFVACEYGRLRLTVLTDCGEKGGEERNRDVLMTSWFPS